MKKPKLATHNTQPNLALYALRITLYAFNPQLATRNPQLISGLTPLLPANFTLLRFTLPTHNFKRDMGQGTRDKTAAISEW
jgi:hypothetical protein